MRHLLRPSTLAMSLSFIFGCSSAPPPKTATPDGRQTPSRDDGAPSAAIGSEQSGTASYYADSLTGRPTASGEPYNPAALTAAHRTLPFGTMVEVTREDGRKVVVRINDRGPFGKKKRIIDLSRSAADQLGIIRAGVARVTVRVIGREPAR
jgi:rare lipoprotein A